MRAVASADLYSNQLRAAEVNLHLEHNVGDGEDGKGDSSDNVDGDTLSRGGLHVAGRRALSLVELLPESSHLSLQLGARKARGILVGSGSAVDST